MSVQSKVPPKIIRNIELFTPKISRILRYCAASIKSEMTKTQMAKFIGATLNTAHPNA